MLEIKKVNKTYDENKKNSNHVLKDISLTLPNTGLITLFGKSGSGKTTLLNIIGGLDSFDGEIIYDANIYTKYNARTIDSYRNKNISYIFQNYLLIENMTVYDNLRLALEIEEVYNLEEIDKRITYVLQALGIFKYRKKLARSLSGGQQQRVSIARALLKNASIVIADEPTGNLDRRNAVEVMKILKKISETRLVILVTHSQELASFYSDKIIRLVDGRVIEDGITNLDGLDYHDDNVIYLGDLDNKNLKIENLDIDYYGNNNKRINLRIVQKDDHIYIQSTNCKLSLVDNNVILKDEKYEKLTKSNIDNYNFDTTWYSNEYKKRNNFWRQSKIAIRNFFNSRKRVKFFNVCYLILGILLAVSTILFSIGKNYNYEFKYLDNKWIVKIATKYSDDETLRYQMKYAYEKGYISDISNVEYVNGTVTKNITTLYRNSYSTSVFKCIYSVANNKIILGKEPNINEIVISEGLLNEIENNLSISTEEVFECKYNLNGDYYNIVGVVEESGKAIYLSQLYLHPELLNKYQVNLINKNSIEYTIVEGKDTTNKDELVAIKDTGYKINDTVGEYKVVGIADINKNKYKRMLITSLENKEIANYYLEDTANHYIIFDNKVEIVEGREPLNHQECVVPEYFDVNINQNYQGYLVVGKYRGDITKYYNSIMLLEHDYDLMNVEDMCDIMFDIIDYDAFTNYLTSNYETINMYENELKNYNKNKLEKFIFFLSLALTLFILSTLYIYFIMRNKLIHNKYELAVYRSIGAKKSYIYKNYFIDLLVLTVFTNLIGYLGTYFLAVLINRIARIVTLNLLNLNFLVFFSGVLLVFITNIGVGLLPVYFKLRKTPAELITDYDA